MRSSRERSWRTFSAVWSSSLPCPHTPGRNHASNSLDRVQNAIEMLGIHDLDHEVELRLLIFTRRNFRAADIRFAFGNRRRHIRQYTGFVYRQHRHLHAVDTGSRRVPLDVDQSFPIIVQGFEIGASDGMDGQPTPTRDIAHDAITGHGITASR